MRASFGPGCGTLTSSHCRTSGPPVLWKRIAWAMASFPRRRESSDEGALRAENCTRGDAGRFRPLRRGNLLAFLGLHLRDLDLAALRRDADRRGPDVGDLADLALHRAEGADPVLPRAE